MAIIPHPRRRSGGAGVVNGRQMYRSATIVCALVLTIAGRGHACWMGIDPYAFGQTCPIIVTGQIVAIDEPEQYTPVIPPVDMNVLHTARAYAVAHIKVTRVHKAMLSDVPVEVGGEVLARMHSANDTVKISTDLHYPVGTRALWMIYLAGDGEFYICEHPVQRQELEEELDLETLARHRRSIASVQQPDGRLTRAEWVADRKRIEDKQREQRRKDAALSKAANELFANAFPDGQPDAAGFAAILEVDKELRERVLSNVASRTGPDLEGRAALAEYMMDNDPDYMVRSHAMRYLRNKVGRPGVERAFYVKHLDSPDPKARAHACFIIWRKENADLVPKVRGLLSDEHEDVRRAAAKALEQAQRAAERP